MRFNYFYSSVCVVFFFSASLNAKEALHELIDRQVEQKAKGMAVAAIADDMEFLRRASLDFLGRIPTLQEQKDFLADKSTDKRKAWIDKALASKRGAKRLADFFHVHFMERLGDNPQWREYLENSFFENKPWNVMASEILRGKRSEEQKSGAGFFISKRLENYGQNPVDYSGLARDVGRLFLGKDLRCAECHDHLFVEEYKQQDFKGLFAFFENTYLKDAKTMLVAEKLTSKKLEYASVFKKEKKETGPRVPGLVEVSIPDFPKGQEYLVPPDPKKKLQGVPKFSPLEELSKTLPDSANASFSRNMVNRIWFFVMGRGLVHPLDLHHAGNPASHPELLDLLTREFQTHKYDVRWLISELAKSKTYQRASRMDQKLPAREFFVYGLEKRLSAEQLLASILVATGRWNKDKPVDETPLPEALMQKYMKAFANAGREPEDEIAFSLQAALFLLNDSTVLKLLEADENSLVAQLEKTMDERKAIELAWLSTLIRKPSEDEVQSALEVLKKAKDSKYKVLVWGLLASSEFNLNH
ncbi:MAG: hypothetical protein RL595_3125 [Planctomycetota bacterium]|jgi:hypothetical protein